MFNKLFDYFSDIFYLGSGVLFIASMGLLTLNAILFFILSKFKKEFGIKNRLAFFVLSFALVILEYFSSSILGERDFSLFLLVYSLLISLPLFLIKPKRSKQSKKDEMTKFIDSKIKDGINYEILNKNPNKSQSDVLSCRQENDEKREVESLDFSHVKNVLQRINAFSLSSQDRKQVRDLESYILDAERGNYDLETKEKINDGLGALLKIMSKYGA